MLAVKVLHGTEKFTFECFIGYVPYSTTCVMFMLHIYDLAVKPFQLCLWWKTCYFCTRSQDIPDWVCGDQNMCFKPSHDLFLTLTKWFSTKTFVRGDFLFSSSLASAQDGAFMELFIECRTSVFRFEPDLCTRSKTQPAAFVTLPAGLSGQNPIWSPFLSFVTLLHPHNPPCELCIWHWYIRLNCFSHIETNYNHGIRKCTSSRWLSPDLQYVSASWVRTATSHVGTAEEKAAAL